MLSLRAARERERESSLRTSSSLKFKKSFTLIELSIVLLILSLLVGSLLVGRQIVDRAKIQRIIFEFDYYEKAFHQFYDTYRAVPGSLSYKECIKHAIFRGGYCNGYDYQCLTGGKWTEEYNHQKFCEKFTLTKSDNRKLVSDLAAGLGSMYQIMVAGLIEEDKMCRLSTASPDVFHSWYLFGVVWRQNYHVSSFDKNVFLRFRAFHSTAGLSAYLGSYAKSNKNLGATYFYNYLVDKNFLWSQGISFEKDKNGAMSVTPNRYVSALNSKLTSELDAKIDDGRPTTGNLIGLKPIKAWTENNAEISKQYCYDASGNDIEHAIYNSSTNAQYGCDLVYVLKPVK